MLKGGGQGENRVFVKGTGYRVGGSGGQPGANATSRRGALSRGAAGRGASRGGGWEEESGLDEWGRQRHREVEGHDPCGAPAERQPFAQAWFGTTAVGYVDVSPPPIGSIGRDRRLVA